MTWQEYAASRKHLLEERIGTRVRQAKREEDEIAAANRKALRGAR